MRNISAAFAERLGSDATTLCHAWRLTRRDGTVFGFTDHDAELTFDGMTFQAATGFDASDAETALGLSVGSQEVAGAFSAACITDKDLKDGRFDGARVEVFLVDWQKPDLHLRLRTEEIGEVTSDGNSFRAELRSVANRLQQVQGRVYTRRCDAVLGDARCTIDLDDPAYRGEGTVVSAAGDASCAASGLDGFDDRWFRFGRIDWTSGANEGLSVEVEDHRKEPGGATIDFWVPMPNPPLPGDRFVITAGCAKTFEACGAKFANRLNFQGFPHLPGSDFAYGYADKRTVHDGRPLVR